MSRLARVGSVTPSLLLLTVSVCLAAQQIPGDSIEGWTTSQVREALGSPSMNTREPDGTIIWLYHHTSKGTVTIYFTNDRVVNTRPDDGVRELWLKELARRSAEDRSSAPQNRSDSPVSQTDRIPLRDSISSATPPPAADVASAASAVTAPNASPGLAIQEQLSAEKRADILRLLEATSGSEMTAVIIEGLTQQVLVQVAAQGMTEEAQRIHAEVLKEFLGEQLASGAFNDRVVGIYHKHLTHDEINAALTFWNSEIGKKMTRVNPALTRDVMNDSRAFFESLQPTFQQRLEERFDAAGIDPPGADLLVEAAELINQLPLENATELRAPGDSRLVLLEVLGGHAGLKYDPLEWWVADTHQSGWHQFEHAQQELVIEVIDERTFVPVDTLPGVALVNAWSNDRNAWPSRHGVRVVNGLRTMFLDIEAITNRIPVTLVGHFYSDSSGSVQIVAWAGRNLIDEFRATIERFVSSLQLLPDVASGDPDPASEQSVQVLRDAAERGDAEAQYSLGARYQSGTGVPRWAPEATRWFREAAEQGHAEAQYALGLTYENGVGITPNPEQATPWFHRAAHQGHPVARYFLGVKYDRGRGVLQNAVTAHMWFRLALAHAAPDQREIVERALKAVAGRMTADQVAEAERLAREWKPAPNESDAQVRDAPGVEEETDPAARRVRRAADRGDQRAQFELGAMYMNGRGISQDDVEALRWFYLSAEKGHTAARYNVRAMEARMAAEQIAEAQRLARAWKPSVEE